jgi:hypothetical protein
MERLEEERGRTRSYSIVTQTNTMIFQNILPTLDSLNQSAK